MKKNLPNQKALLLCFVLLLIYQFSFTQSVITNLNNLTIDERDPATVLAPDITITGSNSYDDNYIEFTYTGGGNAGETLAFLTSSTPDVTSGEVSIVGTTIYLGEGSTAKIVGTVDDTYNGLNGNNLRINFSAPLTNAKFTDEVVNGVIPGWTPTLGTITLGSLATRSQGNPVSSSGSSAPYTISGTGYTFLTDQNYDASARSAWGYESVERPDRTPTTSVTVVTDNDAVGGKALYLKIRGSVGPYSSIKYGSHFGPEVWSEAFSASAGDEVKLSFKAVRASDHYECYGYLVNTSTNAHTLVLYGRGGNLAWTETSGTVPSDGEYKFRFVNGTYDASGGLAVGSDMWIDNIRIAGSDATDALIQKLARKVTYENTSCTPDATREITFNALDTDGDIATSSLTITINPIQFVVGSISSDQTICYNNSPEELIGVAPTGGGGSVTYQWQSSADNSTFTNISDATSLNYQPGNLTVTTYYQLLQTADCGTLTTNKVTITVYNNFTPGEISATGETICYNVDPAEIGSTTAASGGDGTITYKWESSIDAFATAGTVISGATATTYDPPSGLQTTTSYRRYAHDGTCNTTFEVSTGTWTVTVRDDFTPGAIETTSETICYNGDPAEIGSTTAASGGDGTITYKWESSIDAFATAGTVISGATAATYDPPSGLQTTTSYRRYAHDGTCNTTFEVSTGTWTVTVRDDFTPGAIETTSETICYNGDPAEIGSTTAASGGDGTITYKWESSIDAFATAGTVISGATATTYDPPSGLQTTTSYRRYAHDGTCNTTFEVSTGTWTVTVRDDFTPGAIETTSETICYNGDPAEIGSTTAASGGDGTITYKWESSIDAFATAGTVISGATAATYDPPSGLQTTTSYRRYAHDGTCNTTFEVSTGTWTVTVRDDFTPGAIETTSETICYNGDPAEIGSTTAASGGDGTITYKWESSIDAFATAGTVISGATAATYDPPSGLQTTTSYRRYAHDGTCNTTFEVSTGTWTVTVLPELSVGSISSDQTICYNTAPDELVGVAPSGGDGSYTYQWQSSTDNVSFTDISDANSLNYQPGNLTATTYYQLLQTANCGTLTTNKITISVYTEFTAGEISSTHRTICYNGDPSSIGSTTAASGGDGNITYKWESSTDAFATAGSVINGATAATYDPPAGLQTTTSYRRYAHDGSCNASFEVSVGTCTVTVRENFIVGSISSDQTICYNTAPDELVGVAPSGGGNEYEYQWQYSKDGINFSDIYKATSLDYQPENLEETTHYQLIQSSASGCGNLITNPITITVRAFVPSPVIHEKKMPNNVSILFADNSADLYDSYLWTYDDGSDLPPDLVNDRQFLTLPIGHMNNTYMLTTFDQNGCGLQSLSRTVTPNQMASAVYPTISNGKLTLDIAGPEKGRINIRVYNEYGNILKVYEFEKTTTIESIPISLSGLNVGLYMVEISINNYKETHKIFIK